EGERASGRLLPVSQGACGGTLMGLQKAVPATRVERRVLREPRIRPGLAPEGQNRVRRHLVHHLVPSFPSATTLEYPIFASAAERVPAAAVRDSLIASVRTRR